MTREKCMAVPLRGDGSLWCELEAGHSGLHRGAGEDEGMCFRRTNKGTSGTARDRQAARRIRIMQER